MSQNLSETEGKPTSPSSSDDPGKNLIETQDSSSFFYPSRYPPGVQLSPFHRPVPLTTGNPETRPRVVFDPAPSLRIQGENMFNTTKISRDILRSKARLIRDELEIKIARDGSTLLSIEVVDNLLEFLHDLKAAKVTVEDLSYSRIHRAITLIVSAATRWSPDIIEVCLEILGAWEEQFPEFMSSFISLYAPGGRLHGICEETDLHTPDILIKWMTDPKLLVSPFRSFQTGHVGIKPGAWWINSLFAFRDGVIDSPDSYGGISADSSNIYAILITGKDELGVLGCSQTIAYCCRSYDAGKEKLIRAATYPKQLIRVLRSETVNSEFRPAVGVRYEGLFIARSYQHKTEGDELICIFVLERQDDQLPMTQVILHPTAEEREDYAEYKRNRNIQETEQDNTVIENIADINTTLRIRGVTEAYVRGESPSNRADEVVTEHSVMEELSADVDRELPYVVLDSDPASLQFAKENSYVAVRKFAMAIHLTIDAVNGVQRTRDGMPGFADDDEDTQVVPSLDEAVESIRISTHSERFATSIIFVIHQQWKRHEASQKGFKDMERLEKILGMLKEKCSPDDEYLFATFSYIEYVLDNIFKKDVEVAPKFLAAPYEPTGRPVGDPRAIFSQLRDSIQLTTSSRNFGDIGEAKDNDSKPTSTEIQQSAPEAKDDESGSRVWSLTQEDLRLANVQPAPEQSPNPPNTLAWLHSGRQVRVLSAEGFKPTSPWYVAASIQYPLTGETREPPTIEHIPTERETVEATPEKLAEIAEWLGNLAVELDSPGGQKAKEEERAERVKEEEEEWKEPPFIPYSTIPAIVQRVFGFPASAGGPATQVDVQGGEIENVTAENRNAVSQIDEPERRAMLPVDLPMHEPQPRTPWQPLSILGSRGPLSLSAYPFMQPSWEGIPLEEVPRFQYVFHEYEDSEPLRLDLTIIRKDDSDSPNLRVTAQELETGMIRALEDARAAARNGTLEMPTTNPHRRRTLREALQFVAERRVFQDNLRQQPGNAEAQPKPPVALAQPVTQAAEASRAVQPLSLELASSDFVDEAKDAEDGDEGKDEDAASDYSHKPLLRDDPSDDEEGGGPRRGRSPTSRPVEGRLIAWAE